MKTTLSSQNVRILASKSWGTGAANRSVGHGYGRITGLAGRSAIKWHFSPPAPCCIARAAWVYLAQPPPGHSMLIDALHSCPKPATAQNAGAAAAYSFLEGL